MKWLFKKWVSSLTFFFIISLNCKGRNFDYFVNFELANNKIYVLHADGDIKIFDDSNGKLLDTYSQKSKITTLTKDHTGNIIIADAANDVKRLSSDNQWLTIASLKGDQLLRVLFDNRDNCFLITQKGLFDLENNKNYLPDRHFAHSEWAYHGSPFWESLDNDIGAYIDNNNNIWIDFNHGEWGNDLFVFNQQTHSFIPVKGYGGVPYYEANNQLFSTTHSWLWFTLIKYSPVYDKDKHLIEFEGTKIYSIEDVYGYQTKKQNTSDIDIFPGNSAYNTLDNNFYFISSNGLRKTKISAPIHKFSDFTPVKNFMFPKNITKANEYYDGAKHQIRIENGYPQYVSKLEFTSKGKLVLLPSSYGVWLFDGKKLTIVE